jgi:arylsulfatase A-like enzyme
MVTAALSACGAPASRSAPAAIRLVDLFEPSAVEAGAVVPAALAARTEWVFSRPAEPGVPEKLAATHGWEAAAGISGFAVKDGRLSGRATTDFPVIHLERTSGLGDHDILHALEIRLRVSAGTNLALRFQEGEKIDVTKSITDDGFRWRMKTPITAGESIRTYVVRNPFAPASSDIRHILIRPTDASGATFEIESIRLIFRREYLEGIPSGVSWQGLSEIYHETIVSRAPESIRLDLTLPRAPWLDLAVGTVEDGPVTFDVGVARAGRDGDETRVLQRTVTSPHRWEPVPIDLSAWAGERVRLRLSLSGVAPGRIGFWGSPVIRSHGAAPLRTAETASATGAPPPQGVILIWADTLRRDHLDAYGYARATAPHLKVMASEGAIFRDCVGQATWTKVATPSLMTSLYPTTHGVKEFTDRLPSSATTIAEVYRDAGYATLSFSSILFTGKFTNLHQGFEELHEDGSLPDRESSKTARVFVDRLLPWLDAHRDVPFFVFLHVSDPHDPYRPYPPYDTMWADPSKREVHEKQEADVKKFISDPLLKSFGMPTRDELAKAGLDAGAFLEEDRDWYDGSIRGMDAEIGRLLERVRSLGLDRQTLVVFTGDHGEEFLEHGRMFHGQSTYGELSNVTLMMRSPGRIPGGISVGETVETIDVMPTLLEISGLRPPDGIQGRSFLPLLMSARPLPAIPGAAHAATGEEVTPEARAWRDRPAITEKAVITDVGGPPPRDTEALAITLDGWKLIHNTKRPDGKPEFELYDERVDPLNLADVAAAHPEIVERLGKDLGAWRVKAAAARLTPDAEATKSLSPEELQRLRSLGYVQ